MKKEIGIKIGAIAICTTLLVLTMLYFVQRCIQDRLDLRKTYVAVKDIEPRHKIQEEDLMEMEVPGMYLQDSAYCRKEDIVGKYTDIQGKIPAGSLFYRSMLQDEKELGDYAQLQLKPGQVLYALQSDMADSVDFVEGQRVDVYVTMEKESVMTGCLLKHARIVSIKDHKGLSLQDTDSTGIPYRISLAINQDDIAIVSLAEKVGRIRLFSCLESYDSDVESVLDEESFLTAYLRSQLELNEVVNNE